MLKETMKTLVQEKKRAGLPDFVIANFLKEVLQFPVLSYIYNSKEYKNFIFTGGSCLRICYGLSRLSEDLDFDLEESDFRTLDLEKMGTALSAYFENNFLIVPSFRVQGKNRLYLKFPILKDLGLIYGEKSDFLYVKIEPEISQFEVFETELSPVSSFGFNFLAKNYTLKFLMTGKIMAILGRKWFKGKNNVIDIKGRDFYDLFWYLSKGISPDFAVLEKAFSIKDENELKQVLKNKIEKEVDERKLAYDLQNFFPDQSFVTDFCKNYKEIMKKYLV
ncbi:MAG: nucleotidyl transferase AbiEii/AbiGii toxin family protein [Candidatus Paceibacterota bacterium]|jgi:hypothetical protein